MKSKRNRQISKEELTRCAEKLHPWIRDVISGLGFGLLEISFVNENNLNYLRVTISHKDQKITLDDCERASREVGKQLDLTDPIPFPYMLEVQSPGINYNSDKIFEHQFLLKDLNLVVYS